MNHPSARGVRCLPLATSSCFLSKLFTAVMQYLHKPLGTLPTALPLPRLSLGPGKVDRLELAYAQAQAAPALGGVCSESDLR